MTEKFFEFNKDNFEQFLESKGFLRSINHHEVVYFRRHHILKHLMVKIYTTISADRHVVRNNGADAIRIVAIFDNGDRNFGVGKFPKIYRRVPEQINTIAHKERFLFNRVYLRLREAYARCNQWCKEHHIHNPNKSKT